MEIPCGKIYRPTGERPSLSSSVIGSMKNLTRLAALMASLSLNACSSPRSYSGQSGTDVGGSNSSTDAAGETHTNTDSSSMGEDAVIVDSGSARDAADASDVSDAACDIPDGQLIEFDAGDAGDGKVSRAHCPFPGDGKGGGDADAH